MLKQIRCFQAAVQLQSFTKAASSLHVSQSAISQQIKALEQEVGARLLERKGKSVSLTEAGRYFYRQSLVWTADYERMERETRRIAAQSQNTLKLACLNSISHQELARALEAFSRDFPSVHVEILLGSYWDLFCWLMDSKADAAFLDIRQSFRSRFEGQYLGSKPCQVLLLQSSPMSFLDQVELEDLKNTPCIVITSPQSKSEDEIYNREVFKIPGPQHMVFSQKEAWSLAAQKDGYFLWDSPENCQDYGFAAVPLARQGELVKRDYWLFWNGQQSHPGLEAFCRFLQESWKSSQK